MLCCSIYHTDNPHSYPVPTFIHNPFLQYFIHARLTHFFPYLIRDRVVWSRTGQKYLINSCKAMQYVLQTAGVSKLGHIFFQSKHTAFKGALDLWLPMKWFSNLYTPFLLSAQKDSVHWARSKLPQLANGALAVKVHSRVSCLLAMHNTSQPADWMTCWATLFIPTNKINVSFVESKIGRSRVQWTGFFPLIDTFSIFVRTVAGLVQDFSIKNKQSGKIFLVLGFVLIKVSVFLCIFHAYAVYVALKVIISEPTRNKSGSKSFPMEMSNA